MREALDLAFAAWARATFRHSRVTLIVGFGFIAALRSFHHLQQFR